MSLVSVTDGFGSVVMSTFSSAFASSSSGSGGGGVVVDFDMTVLGQVVLFLILLVVLKPMLFDPMLRLFEERERRIDGAKLLARKIDEKSATALTTYETEMAKARASANAERDKLRTEGLKQESEILARVRASTAKTLEEGRKRMQEDVAQVRTGLRTDAPAMAKELATRVLGREVH
jgi:F-type H+-transporting ATPase subunit b